MNKTSSQVALVAGSSGIVGRQLVNTLLHRGWEVIGLSHRALSQPGAIPMIHVDLRDARHSTQALQPLSTVTHIFYSAWMNAGNWSEMVEPNVTMLRNLVSHVEQNAPLQTVSLMQGYKVYGAHLGPFKTPARESDPGVPGAEFNAAQLAWLRHFQQGKTWHWSAIRPGVVGSPVPGNAMNLALSIALYASLCKALGLPLRFPGTLTTWHSIVDHTDADLLAEATLWAATSPAGKTRPSTSIMVISGAGASCGRASRSGLNWNAPHPSGSHFISYSMTTVPSGASWPQSGWWKRTFCA